MGSSTDTAAAAAVNDRRSAEFHPTVWGDFFLTHVPISQETISSWEEEIEGLKQDVTRMLMLKPNPTAHEMTEKLKLIDTMERLGIGYHFEAEIEEQLLQIHELHGQNPKLWDVCNDLSSLGLLFRLLRQHGYGTMPADIFIQLKNNEGKFNKELSDDIEGMLSLYQASHFRTNEENILDEALEFATSQLESKVALLATLSPLLSQRVAHALSTPLRRGVEKQEQLWFISMYEKEVDHDQTLLKLAKLSWNVLQRLYQHELKKLTKWWIDLDFTRKMPFARDRLVESYLLALGAMWEPKFSMVRYLLTKITKLVSVTDDTYDVYGTIDELELFTSVVDRWDTSCMKDLPKYMRELFEAIIGVLEEIDEINSNQGRPYCFEYEKQAQKNQMKAYMVEARWLTEGKVPSIEEYRRAGIYSSTLPLLAYSAICGLGHKATKQVFDWLITDPKLMIVVADHGRLMDDVMSHQFEQKRWHIPSSVECYMKQYDVSRQEAVEAVNMMIDEDRKDINKEYLNRPSFVSKEVGSVFVGLARVMEVLYKDSDRYTFSDTVTKDMMTALLVTPMC
ncbi:Probable terpene synthase 3 [Linum perenne]